MGMTLEELKEIFGPETKQYNCPKGIGEIVNFDCVKFSSQF